MANAQNAVAVTSFGRGLFEIRLQTFPRRRMRQRGVVVTAFMRFDCSPAGRFQHNGLTAVFSEFKRVPQREKNRMNAVTTSLPKFHFRAANDGADVEPLGPTGRGPWALGR
jgi:hypothetical protein